MILEIVYRVFLSLQHRFCKSYFNVVSLSYYVDFVVRRIEVETGKYKI